MRKTTHDRLMARLADAEEKRLLLCAYTEAERRHLVRLRQAGEVISPEYRTFVRTEYWKSLTRPQQALIVMRTLSAMHPNWVFCGISAAFVHGLWVSKFRLATYHVCIPGDTHIRRRKNLTWHIVRDDKSVVVDGIRVTSLQRSALDSLRSLGLAEGLAIADSFLRATGRDVTWLSSQLKAFARHRGIVQARTTAPLADGRSESGGESIARATILELGYQAPDIQVVLQDPIDRNRSYRADFCWSLPDSTLVVGELDGREKYVNPDMTHGRSSIQVLADERLRESRIAALGARVMRFSYADVLNRDRFDHILASFGIPRAPAPRRRPNVSAA